MYTNSDGQVFYTPAAFVGKHDCVSRILGRLNYMVKHLGFFFSCPLAGDILQAPPVKNLI